MKTEITGKKQEKKEWGFIQGQPKAMQKYQAVIGQHHKAGGPNCLLYQPHISTIKVINRLDYKGW